MLKNGILNPAILALLARVRHTNLLVIADRGFPSWPHVETIDISLTDDIPTVLDVLTAIRPNFVIAQAWMAAEFERENTAAVRERYAAGLAGIPIHHEAHLAFKQRIPAATGLIRTGDTIQYGNLIVQSG